MVTNKDYFEDNEELSKLFDERKDFAKQLIQYECICRELKSVITTLDNIINTKLEALRENDKREKENRND